MNSLFYLGYSPQIQHHKYTLKNHLLWPFYGTLEILLARLLGAHPTRRRDR